MHGRTAQTLLATRLLYILQPKQLEPRTTPPAPRCGNDQEQSQSPWHSPSVVFVFRAGAGGEWVDGWAGVGPG